jgi:outer membrane protein assembly factor BamB
LTLVAVLLPLVAAAPGWTQGWAGATRAAEGAPTVHPPTDRLLSRGMREAQQSIARGEFVQALAFLDDLLGRSEDYFTETGAEGGFAGLKETARGLIRDLPPGGRGAYEAAYGPVAERLLRESLAAGDASKLLMVVQRYFYTPAGYQAALLAAADESDAGRHLAAALIYQQLLDTPAAVALLDPELSVRAAESWLAAGEAPHAEQIVATLASRGPARVDVGGRTYTLAGDARPLEWLRTIVGEPAGTAAAPERQWLTYRGNAARNGETAGGLPHMRVRWRVRLLSPFPKLEELFHEYREGLLEQGGATSVAAAPLSAGDYVIVRSPLGLMGVDFRTGKLVWQSERTLDPQINVLVKSGGRAEDEMANAEPARAFVHRMWDDYLYGITSSDGARVYAVRDLPMAGAQDYEFTPFMTVAGPDMLAPSNRLSAYELAREGALAWEIDGAVAAGDLSGAFFLGAPLPVGSTLYALMEIRDDIYLVALDRATGALQWRQQLANLETGVLMDLRRRLQSSMPSYDSGILVCPTGAGLVVGVDLAKRSLAWAYQYKAASPLEGGFRGGLDAAQTAAADGRWTDGAAMIAGGRVLITPPESDELHCLDLRTGRLLWKRPRNDNRSLACVHQGIVLLVGAKKLTALRLDDGRPAWPGGETALPRGAAPAGAGFVSDGKYFFPLTNAEVIAVDLAAGRIVATVRSPDGAPLGNLICHRGTVISQNGMYLDCFDQVDSLLRNSEQRLAANPDDVDALRALGEIAYNAGRLSEAIDFEQRAYRLAPDDLDVREMLAECLTDALDENFAAHRSSLALLKELQAGGAVSPLEVVRIEAQGLLQTGDPLGSATATLAMAHAAADPREMLALRGNHQAMAGRWIQAQLAAAWDAADAEQRAAMGVQLEQAAAGLTASASPDEIERFLDFYGAMPQFDGLKLRRAVRLNDDKRTLESQQALLDLAHSADAAIRNEAVARLAIQLHEAGLHGSAREFDELLAGPLAETPCLDGATGREVLEPYREAIAANRIVWPGGRVEVRNVTAAGGAGAAGRARNPVWSIRLEHGDAILGSGVGLLGMRGAELEWQDGYGRPVFSTTFEDQAQSVYRQSGSVYASSRGSLLVVSLGRELAAFNTLARGDGQTRGLAWRASLGSNFDYQGMYLDDLSRASEARPGSFRPQRMVLDGKWMGVIGPVTSQGCVFQDQRRLVCVNPISGEVLWSRGDVPPGCDLFGDDRYVFATPVGARMAKVYSAIDGRALGEARVPAWSEQLATRGRQVIRWTKNRQGEFQLAAVDPLTKQVAWSHDFALGARVDVDIDRFIAVAEPKGRATIIDAETGAVVSDHPQLFTPQPRLDQVHLAVGADSYVVTVEHPAARNADRGVRAFNALDSPVVDGEVIALDRRTGAPLWPRPASVLHQALVLNQPADMPIILFAGTLAVKNRNEGRDATAALILDKATGRSLYASDELPPTGAGNCAVQLSDADRREITIDMAGNSLLVQFTDRRRPPEPPAMAEVESPAGKGSDGILGILRILGGGD